MDDPREEEFAFWAHEADLASEAWPLIVPVLVGTRRFQGKAAFHVLGGCGSLVHHAKPNGPGGPFLGVLNVAALLRYLSVWALWGLEALSPGACRTLGTALRVPSRWDP